LESQIPKFHGGHLPTVRWVCSKLLVSKKGSRVTRVVIKTGWLFNTDNPVFVKEDLPSKLPPPQRCYCQ
jgi:hypothetical protein